VRIIAVALVDERYRGPINGVAPHEVTSRLFGKALGRALHRPAILPTPAFVLRLIFGEAASVLLGSQRVEPAALRERGFAFVFPTLDAALANILGGANVTIAPLSSPPSSPEGESGGYLDAHPPTHELRTTTIVNAPLDQVFAFFSKAGNLGMLTPASMHFSIVGTAPAIAQGATIDYQLRVGPVPIAWRSLIAKWEPGRGFVDLQERGPYRVWWHHHGFRADGMRTVMEDRVYYAPPLGVLGRLVNAAFIAPALRRVFQYREEVIRLRFGVS
jgi:ligand-binding SRPBCC domain-containing protein